MGFMDKVRPIRTPILALVLMWGIILIELIYDPQVGPVSIVSLVFGVPALIFYYVSRDTSEKRIDEK